MATMRMIVCAAIMIQLVVTAALAEDSPSSQAKGAAKSVNDGLIWTPTYSNEELVWRRNDARKKMSELMNLEQMSEQETEFLFWIRHTHRLLQALLVERMMCEARLQLGLIPPDPHDPDSEF